MPKIAGSPSSEVEQPSLSKELKIDLHRCGVDYTPVVEDGQHVELGEALANAWLTGGYLILPSPATGKVSIDGKGEAPSHVILETAGNGSNRGKREQFRPEDITPGVMRDALTKGGIWPFFWSSRTGGMPALENGRGPKAIILTCVLAEPFRARGNVILEQFSNRVSEGIKFLQRITVEHGTTNIVTTRSQNAGSIISSLDPAVRDQIRVHDLPFLYPMENPSVLSKALRRSDPSVTRNDEIWVIDVQGVEAIGACLSEGLPLHERVVAVGGPGCSRPRHLRVRIGTPLADLFKEDCGADKMCVLRGGLFKGEPIDLEADAVQYDDDAFFFLPGMTEREFLSFTRPGIDRTSALPCFASKILGTEDKCISTSLRGERRACIACGLCEKLCPTGLLPQVLHRYLYNKDLDEAEAMGLHLCVDCNLCTYVCPSKIELQREIAEAREQLRQEKEEALAAEERG